MKKLIVPLLVATVVGIIVVSGVVVAFGTGFISSDQRLAIRQAIENNDYNAWRNAVIATLTKENFDKLVEKYKEISEITKLKNSIKQAIENKDYKAYKEAAEKLASYMILSEEEFNALVEQGAPIGRFWHHARLGMPCRFHKFWQVNSTG